MDVNISKNKIFQGTAWASFEKMAIMGLQFLVNLILARLLVPSDFGCIGMLYIFITVSQTLIDGGFGSALIQKKEPSQTDYSTIFYWNIVFATLLYALLYVLSPFIAQYYRMEDLSLVLRVLGLTLIINAFNIIQYNRLRKLLDFKKIAIINIVAYLLAAVIAIIFAYYGYGVWSLVLLQIIYALLTCVLLWIYTQWRPSYEFSFVALKELFNYGGYLLLANILQEVCKNMQGLIIGRRFSAVQMGLYTQAQKLDSVASVSLSNVIVQVMFPIFSQLQNDRKQLNNVLEKNIRLISFTIFPLITILMLIAKPLIMFLYGEKWIDCAQYFQILCIGGLFSCLQNINYYVVAALGHSRQLFNWSIYKWSFLLIMLFVGSIWGVYGILWGMVISNVNIYIVNAFLVKKYSGFRMIRQIKILISIFAMVALSALIVILIQKFIVENWCFSIIFFLMIYFLLGRIFRVSVFDDLKYSLRLNKKM